MGNEKDGEMKVRCKNCIKRFVVAPKVDKAACPHCGLEFRISWPKPDLPYIQGLVKK